MTETNHRRVRPVPSAPPPRYEDVLRVLASIDQKLGDNGQKLDRIALLLVDIRPLLGPPPAPDDDELGEEPEEEDELEAFEAEDGAA